MNGRAFAAERQAQVVHRVKYSGPDGADIHVRWLCGGESVDAFFVEDVAISDVCQRCNAIYFIETDSVVYHCHSAGGQLLYIGSTRWWEEREALHVQRTPWWPEVARVEKTPQPDIRTARQAERVAIRAEGPLYNKQHNPKRWRRDGHLYVPVAEVA